MVGKTDRFQGFAGKSIQITDGRTLDNFGMPVGTTRAPLVGMDQRNHMVISNPVGSGGTFFVGGPDVTDAGADGLTFGLKTGIPVYEGLSISLDVTERPIVYVVSRNASYCLWLETF